MWSHIKKYYPQIIIESAFRVVQEERAKKSNIVTDDDGIYRSRKDLVEKKRILVQDIKREAEQNIILYREQLTKALCKKALFQSGQEVNAILNKTIARLNDYQLALYTFSFSSFLEIMLLENFDTNYLNSIASKIQEYSGVYTALYEKCAEKIEKDSKASLEGYALKGLSKLSSGAGKIVEKIPVINKSQLDENLLKGGVVLHDANTNRTQNVIQILADSQTDYISSFVENIRIIDDLYNQSVQLMFDSENIYIAKVAAA